jgi:hypothetical protein
VRAERRDDFAGARMTAGFVTVALGLVAAAALLGFVAMIVGPR